MSARTIVRADEILRERKRPPQNGIETVTFKYEKDLKLFLLSNINKLEHGLQIVAGGIERRVAAGRIDITAEDIYGNTVVIELKRGAVKEKDFTQLLAYMGAIENPDGKLVRGMLVGADFTDRVFYTARAVSNTALKRYALPREGREEVSPPPPGGASGRLL